MLYPAVFSFLFVYAAAAAVENEPAPEILPYEGGISGVGVTTRYWDCCKPACAWVDNLQNKSMTPIATCEVDGYTKADIREYSGCGDGGTAYTCTNQQPFMINSTLAYGFAAASFTGGLDYSLCCSCMLLSFTGELEGKKFLVQITNSGETLAVNQFDLAIPGGGVGIYPLGCMTQWNAPETGWGDPYGGVHTVEECSELPLDLQDGCRWRFWYMEGISNPGVNFYQVQCPHELLEISGCVY